MPSPDLQGLDQPPRGGSRRCVPGLAIMDGERITRQPDSIGTMQAGSDLGALHRVGGERTAGQTGSNAQAAPTDPAACFGGASVRRRSMLRTGSASTSPSISAEDLPDPKAFEPTASAFGDSKKHRR